MGKGVCVKREANDEEQTTDCSLYSIFYASVYATETRESPHSLPESASPSFLLLLQCGTLGGAVCHTKKNLNLLSFLSFAFFWYYSQLFAFLSSCRSLGLNLLEKNQSKDFPSTPLLVHASIVDGIDE